MNYRLGRIVLLSILLTGTHSLTAQTIPLQPADMIKLGSIEAETIASPRYAVDIRAQSIDRDGDLDWLMVKAEFATALQWTDEITFTFYVLLEGNIENLPTGADPKNIFSGTVTIVNVPRVRDGEVTMFLDPYTLARYGKPTHAAVVVTIDGKPAAGMANPESSAASQWWTKKSPNRTPLLTRDKTPYVLVEIDKQNTIKP